MSEEKNVKPGYRTTEFWLSSAAILFGMLSASGVLVAGSEIERVVGLVTSALATLGYSYSRGNAKKS